MPSTLTFPGVYVEELPSGVHTIVGASTAETAFVDFFSRGPVGEAVRITSFSDFERRFGGLHPRSEASYALMQYFLNGGQVAWAVRVATDNAQAAAAVLDLPQDTVLTLKAKNFGETGNRIQYAVFAANPATGQFGLALRQLKPDGSVDESSVAVHFPLTKSTLPTSPLVAFTDLQPGDPGAIPEDTPDVPADLNAATAKVKETKGFISLAGGLDAQPASAKLPESRVSNAVLTLKANTPGEAGNRIQYAVFAANPATGQFGLALRQLAVDGATVVPQSVEFYPLLTKSKLPASPLVVFTDLQSDDPGAIPENTPDVPDALDEAMAKAKETKGFVPLVGGADAQNPQPAVLASSRLRKNTQSLKVEAKDVGTWGQSLQVGVDYQDIPDKEHFNLIIREVATGIGGQKQVVRSEVYRNLSLNPNAINDVNYASDLAELTALGQKRPGVTADDVTNPEQIRNANSPNYRRLDGTDSAGRQVAPTASDGDVPPNGDGNPAGSSWQTSTGATALTAGLAALGTTSFTLLCLPAAAVLDANGMSTVLAAAIQKCQNQRAFFLIDVPRDATQATVPTLATALRSSGSAHAALYFPRLTIPDPLNGYKPRNVGPSGTLAGLYARIDASRGVWKAPAGTEAVLNGVTLAEPLTDAQNGALNPLGINVLRALPVFGTVCWGARTLDGADVMTSDFKYIPVRRLTSYIETSLYESTKWAVFEPNAEPLWAQLRLSIGTFMADLQKQGAFYRYVVRCDETTTTPSDIARGVVNIVVAFAPVKPAEFVVLQIQQLAGQSAA